MATKLKGAGTMYTSGIPTHKPRIETESEFAIDTLTRKIYQYNRILESWVEFPSGFFFYSFNSAPTLTPGAGDPTFVINNLGQMYYWNGTTWVCLNCGNVTLDPYASDALAMADGLVAGDEYILSTDNIYGLPYGVRKTIQ